MFFNYKKPEKKARTRRDTKALTRKYELKILVPIQDDEQGRLTVSILKENIDSRITAIKLFHCIQNTCAYSSWVNPMEVIQIHDNQIEERERSQSRLQELVKDLAAALPGVRVTFNSVVHDSITDAIAEEADNMAADMILLVNDPEKKRHWLFPGVSNRILRTAKCPVQIIKPAKGAQPDSLVFVA
jgi:nucleotide-binding universal stress UspA family protein